MEKAERKRNNIYSDVSLMYRAGALMQWVKLPAWEVGDRGFEPHCGLQVLKKQNVPFSLTRKDSILWGAPVTERRARTDRQGSNFESCVWRAVSSHSSHHPQELLMVQFSLCVHKGGLKPHSFYFIFTHAHFLDLLTLAEKILSTVIGPKQILEC